MAKRVLLNLPTQVYTNVDGATIIELKGLVMDIHLTALAKDELWTTRINELWTNKKPFLTFTHIMQHGSMIRERGLKTDCYADWGYILNTIKNLGWDHCYLRRPVKAQPVQHNPYAWLV